MVLSGGGYRGHLGERQGGVKSGVEWRVLSVCAGDEWGVLRGGRKKWGTWWSEVQGSKQVRVESGLG